MAARRRSNVDVRNIVIPVWMAVSITIGFGGLLATGVIGYRDVTTKVDILISNVGNLSAEAVTKTDLKLFCLELEKNSRGVVCPGSTPAPAKRPALVPRVSDKSTIFQPWFK